MMVLLFLFLLWAWILLFRRALILGGWEVVPFGVLAAIALWYGANPAIIGAQVIMVVVFNLIYWVSALTEGRKPAKARKEPRF